MGCGPRWASALVACCHRCVRQSGKQRADDRKRRTSQGCTAYLRAPVSGGGAIAAPPASLIASTRGFPALNLASAAFLVGTAIWYGAPVAGSLPGRLGRIHA